MKHVEISPQRRCGLVGLAGKPNVGKSTLFNELVGHRLSSVTHKPQTTRCNIRGILTEGLQQAVFVDTPGLHRDRRGALNRLLNRNARHALADVDLVLLVTTCRRWTPDDERVLELVATGGKPCILVLNKVDLLDDKATLLPLIQQLSRRYDFRTVIPVSALKGTSVAQLRDEITAALPAGDFLFEKGRVSDRERSFTAAELIREKVMETVHEELPYAIHVEVESCTVKPKLLHIKAAIWVDKTSQRGIVIGKGGARLKLIGTLARRAIEHSMNTKVFLSLRVRSRKNWYKNPAVIRSYTE